MVTYFQDTIFDTSSALTAPGNGNLLQVAVNNFFATKNYILFVVVENINTNVVIALNGSIDGSHWSKIITNQTITANGTTHYNIANHPVKYIQPVFVSESGGTDASVTFQVAAL